MSLWQELPSPYHYVKTLLSFNSEVSKSRFDFPTKPSRKALCVILSAIVIPSSLQPSLHQIQQHKMLRVSFPPPSRCPVWAKAGHLHAFIAAICLSLALSGSSRINLVDGTTTTAKNLKGNQPFSSLIKAMHFTIEELRSRGGKKNIKLQTIYHPIPQVLLSLVVFLSSQFFMCPFLPYCDIYYIIYIMYHRIISHTIVNLYHNKMRNTQ